MKLKLSRIIEIIILICTLIMLRYILIIPQLEIVGYYWQRFLVDLISIFLAVLVIQKGYSQDIMYRLGKVYLAIYSVIIVYSIIYTWLKYDYSIQSLIFASAPFLYIYMTIPIIYIISQSREDDEFVLIKIVSLLQLLMLFIKTCGWFFYNYLHIGFLSALTTESPDWKRNGLQRVYGGQLVCVAFVYCTYKAFSKKTRKEHKLFYLAADAFCLLFVLVVTQGKFQLMALVLTFVFMYLAANSHHISKLVLIFGTMGICGIGVLAVYAEKFISIFSTSGEAGAGNMARLDTIEYYITFMLKGNWWTGLGLLDRSNVKAYTIMTCTQRRLYYLDDIGSIGAFVRFGVLALLIYGMFIAIAVATLYKAHKQHNYEYETIAGGILFYFVFSNIMLNIFEQNNAFSVPFFLAMLSYMYGKMKTAKNRGIV